METMDMGDGTGFKALEEWLKNEDDLKPKYGNFMNYMRAFAAAIF